MKKKFTILTLAKTATLILPVKIGLFQGTLHLAGMCPVTQTQTYLYVILLVKTTDTTPNLTALISIFKKRFACSSSADNSCNK